MWEAVKYVSSGFTLCAFIVAAITSFLKKRAQETRLRIETAPPEDRASLIAETLEFFDVDTSNLTRQQQFDVAMTQIKAKIERFRLISTVVVALAILGTALSAYAISKTYEPKANPASDTPTRGAVVAPTPPADTRITARTAKDADELKRQDNVQTIDPTESGESVAEIPNGSAGFVSAFDLHSDPFDSLSVQPDGHNDDFAIHKLADGTTFVRGYVGPEAFQHLREGMPAGEDFSIYSKAYGEYSRLIEIPGNHLAFKRIRPIYIHDKRGKLVDEISVEDCVIK